jgi:hypothetical protein
MLIFLFYFLIEEAPDDLRRELTNLKSDKELKQKSSSKYCEDYFIVV